MEALIALLTATGYAVALICAALVCAGIVSVGICKLEELSDAEYQPAALPELPHQAHRFALDVPARAALQAGNVSVHGLHVPAPQG